MKSTLSLLNAILKYNSWQVLSICLVSFYPKPYAYFFNIAKSELALYHYRSPKNHFFYFDYLA